MSSRRLALSLATALIFAVLYAALIVRGIVTGEFGPVEAMTPIATLAVTYLIGTETIKALRRRNGKENGNGDP